MQSHGSATGRGDYRTVRLYYYHRHAAFSADGLRHGARLDAADKQWHLTSPTPYDPPLTYGGWTQSRALGVRIASLLHAREESYHKNVPTKKLDTTTNGDKHTSNQEGGTGASTRPSPVRRRKHNVIIHSSPFLRCIQTSIAIGAGLGQYHGLISSDRGKSTLRQRHHHSGSTTHTHEHAHSYSLSAIQEPDDEGPSGVRNSTQRSRDIPKILLRLDAFLGEWLSPDYYESITPPPGSVMMLASAKAGLLHPGDTVHIAQDSPRNASYSGNFPGGWVSTATDTNDPLSDMSSLAETLPLRDRASSHSAVEGSGRRSNSRALQKINAKNNSRRGYVPPVPSYALSPSDPIPPGYVADARDACIEVDYQWDSSRPPQDWGNGGEYGEEWSSMHKRFRRGLQGMVSWYRAHPEATSEANKHITENENKERAEEEEKYKDDADGDTVLVLVTHGAGCNALIGALTNQPVLLDIGMASLTMAVRKEISITPIDSFMPALDSRRRSSVDAGVSYDYDVPLMASTDHLRSPSSPATTMIPQRAQSSSSQKSSAYRGRFRSISSVNVCESPMNENFKLPETISRKGLQRSSSVSTGGPTTGLWSKPVTETDNTAHPESDTTKTIDRGDRTGDAEDDEAMPLQNITSKQNSRAGLWGASSLEIASDRERGMKRRWTMGEQSL